MTNYAKDALPGWRGTDPDGGTWVRRAKHAANPSAWSYYNNEGIHWARSQAEAEAAGLVPAVAETDAVIEALELVVAIESVADGSTSSLSLNDRVLVVPFATPAPAPLDPGNPEHRDLVADFLSPVANEVNGSAFHHVRETQGVLRSGAVTLRHKIAEAEQDAADRKRAEEYAARHYTQSSDYWNCAIKSYVDALRAERARKEAGQ